MLWIWVTIGAAIGQTVRGAYQKKLKAPLGDLGASYVRFSYALPFAWAWVAGYAIWSGEPLPGVTFTFLAWTTVAGDSRPGKECKGDTRKRLTTPNCISRHPCPRKWQRV